MKVNLYRDGEQLKADIEVYIPPRGEHEPACQACRYAALQLGHRGYVVYDRLLSCIVDGVYHGPDALQNALDVARMYNEDDSLGARKAPNGVALGLVYP